MKLVVTFVLCLAYISAIAAHKNSTEADTVERVSDNGCKCIAYDCGCCQHVELPSTSVNGSLCANATYLQQDYGISLTVTYNNFAIINETVSARNPPPFCVGEDIVEMLQAEICIRLYDIQIQREKYHLCFSLLGKIGKIRIAELKLGCIDNNIIGGMANTIKKDTESLLHKVKMKMTEELPNVIMV